MRNQLLLGAQNHLAQRLPMRKPQPPKLKAEARRVRRIPCNHTHTHTHTTRELDNYTLSDDNVDKAGSCLSDPHSSGWSQLTKAGQ